MIVIRNGRAVVVDDKGNEVKVSSTSNLSATQQRIAANEAAERKLDEEARVQAHEVVASAPVSDRVRIAQNEREAYLEDREASVVAPKSYGQTQTTQERIAAKQRAAYEEDREASFVAPSRKTFQARADEIQKQMDSLNTTLSSLEQGKQQEATTRYDEAIKKTQAQIAQLTGQKSTYDMILAQLDGQKFDTAYAQEQVDKLKAQQYQGQEGWQEQYDAAKKTLEGKQTRDKYAEKTFEDNFWGQVRASYNNGRLGQDIAAAWNAYLDDPTAANKAYAEDLEKAQSYFQENNAATLAEDAKLPWLSQSAAGYLPQLGDQLKAQSAGAIGGAGIGMLVGNPVTGAKVGATIASGTYSYGQARGAAYKTLKDLGVDEKIARQAASDEAVLSAATEMADTLLDLATLGTAKLATVLGKEGIKGLGSYLAKWAGKDVAKNFAIALGKYGVNIVGEYGEEAVQEAIGLANQRRVNSGNVDGGAGALTADSLKTLWNAVTGKDAYAAQQIHSAGKEGAKLAIMSGGLDLGVSTSAAAVNTAQVGANVKAQYGDMALVRATKDHAEKDSASYKMAVRLEAQVKKTGKELTNLEVGQLYNTIQSEAQGVKPQTKAEQKQEEVLDNLSRSENPGVQQYAEVQMQNPDVKVVSPYAQELMDSGMAPEQAVSQAALIEKAVAGQTLTREEQKQVQLGRESVRQVFVKATGIEVTDAQSRNGKDRRQIFKSAQEIAQAKQEQQVQAAAVPAQESAPVTPQQDTTAAEAALVDILEAAQKQAEPTLQFEDGTTMTATEFEAQYKQANPEATTEQAVQAFLSRQSLNEMGVPLPGSANKADLRQSLMTEEAPAAAAQDILGRELSAEAVKDVQDMTVKTLDSLAKKFGASVRLADDMDAPVNGYYDPATKTIVLNRKKATTQRLVVNYFAHELVHHGVEINGKPLVKEILAAAELMGDGEWVTKKTEQVQKTYTAFHEKQGQSFTAAMRDEEVAADYLIKAMSNRAMLDTLAGHKPGLVRQLAGRIKAAMTGRSKEMTGTLEMQRLLDRLQKSMAAAEKNKNTAAESGAGKKYALGGSDFNEYAVQAALYDALDHEGGRNENLIRVSSMPRNIVENFGIEGDLYLQRNHAYENMVSKEQAIQDGRSVTRKGEDIHFHDHGIEKMTDAILAISDPTLALSVKSKTGNPTVLMLLPEFGKNGAPLYAVLSFYSDKGVNGDLSRKPHVVLTIAERDFFGEGGRVGYSEIVQSAVKDGRVLMYNKKRGDDLSLIANPAGVGNITDAFLEKNLARFRKEVKEFKEKNNIRYAIDPDTGYETGSVQDRVLKVLKSGMLDDAVKLLQQWADEVAQGKVQATPEEQTLRDAMLARRPVTPEEATANRTKLTELIQQYGQIKVGEKSTRPVFLPKQTSYTRGVSEFARTVAGSKHTPEWFVKEIERAAVNEESGYTYDIATDKAAMAHVEAIKNKGYGVNKADWDALVRRGDTPKKNDIALGEFLYTEAVKAGNLADATKFVAELCEIGTAAGQTVQAMSLLNKMTPSGQLYYLMKAVDRMNKQHSKRIDAGKMGKITIDQKLAEAVLSAQTIEDTKKAMDVLLQDIADQVPVTWAEKWNAWRYLSMLGNPKTHVRNMISNAVFQPVVFMKDMVGAALESAVMPGRDPTGLKTKNLGQAMASSLYGLGMTRKDAKNFTLFGHTFKPSEWRIKAGEYVTFADQDYLAMRGVLTGGGKHNPADEIRDKRNIFGKKGIGKAVEWASRTNSNLMEKEDAVALQTHYVRALSQYLAAQKADVNTLNSTAEGRALLSKARAYAVQEAQKATFRDASALASALNRFEKSGLAGQVIAGGLFPFKKTPINILKRGLEYSPLGIIEAVWDAVKGKSDAAKFIDSLSAGLTGAAITSLGFYLAAQGLLRAGGSDDERERRFEEIWGEQSYSLKLHDGTSYTIDWMAPAALPLFVGVEWYNLKRGQKDGELELADILDGLSMISGPMFQLSMLDGLNKALKAAGYGENAMIEVGISLMTNYFGQAIPTLLKQINRTFFDDTSRGTFIQSGTRMQPFQRAYQSNILGGVPGLSDERVPYLDAWGRAETQSNLLLRAFENFLSPGYASKVERSPMEDELLRLYKATGDGGVLPTTVSKYFNVGKERHNLTADEWVTYQTTTGQLAYQLITELVNSAGYAQLTDVEKAKAVNSLYDYANEKGRAAAVKAYTIDTAWIEKAEGLLDKGISLTDFVVARVLDQENPGQSKLDTINASWLADADKAAMIGAAKIANLSNDYSLTDTSQSNHAWVLTEAQNKARVDYYDKLWTAESKTLMEGSYYKSLSAEDQAALLTDLESNVLDRTNAWLSEQMTTASQVNPASVSTAMKNSPYRDELTRLYNETGVDVILTDAGSSVGSTQLTGEQMVKYRELRTKATDVLLDRVLGSDQYKALDMDDYTRAKALRKAMDYVDEVTKTQIIDGYEVNGTWIERYETYGLTDKIEPEDYAFAVGVAEANGETNATADIYSQSQLTDVQKAYVSLAYYAKGFSEGEYVMTDKSRGAKNKRFYLTEEQRTEYLEYYDALFAQKLQEMILSNEYANAGTAGQAVLFDEMKAKVAEATKEYFSYEWPRQGIYSEAKR